MSIAAVPPGGLTIRPMGHDDLPAVHRLECAAQPDPWTLEQLAAELDTPCASVDLAWLEGELAGFLCSWLIAGELQIQNVATAPACRRRGVAAALLAAVLERARAAGMESAWLEVRAGNEAAIVLYRRFGFNVVDRRPRYYPDGEDALVMCYQP